MEQAEANQKALLVRQEELERSTRAAVVELERSTRASVLEATARIAVLEHKGAQQEGFFSGAKALWAVIISVPAAIVAYLAGGNSGS